MRFINEIRNVNVYAQEEIIYGIKSLIYPENVFFSRLYQKTSTRKELKLTLHYEDTEASVKI